MNISFGSFPQQHADILNVGDKYYRVVHVRISESPSLKTWYLSLLFFWFGELFDHPHPPGHSRPPPTVRASVLRTGLNGSSSSTGTSPRFPSLFIISRIKLGPTGGDCKGSRRRADLHSSAFVMILMMMMAKWTVWFLCAELVIKNQYYIKGATLVIKDFGHSGYSS